MRRAYERLLVRAQPGCSRRPQHRPWDGHQEQQQQLGGNSQSLEEKLCVLQGAELEKEPKLLEGAQKTGSESRYWTLC